MVDRLENKETEKALTVVDLDGTYVTANTLREYILTGLRHHLRHGRLWPSIRISALMALRILRLVSHKTMKFGCLAALSSISNDRRFHDDFSEQMRASVNDAVAAYLETKRRQGHAILLATAAPDCYVPLIWDGDYVATASADNADRTECRGEEKLRRVLDYARAHNCRIDTVITDHPDDAPLLRYNSAGTNILVRPSDKTLRFFRELEPAHFLLIEQVDKLGVAR